MDSKAFVRTVAIVTVLLLFGSCLAWMAGFTLSSGRSIAYRPEMADRGRVDTIPHLGLTTNGSTLRSIDEWMLGSLFDPRYIARNVRLYRVDCDRPVFDRLVLDLGLRPPSDPNVRAPWSDLAPGRAGWSREPLDLRVTADFAPDHPTGGAQFACSFDGGASRMELWSDVPAAADPALKIPPEAKGGVLPLRWGGVTEIPELSIAVAGDSTRSISRIALLTERATNEVLYRIDCDREVFERLATAHRLRAIESVRLAEMWTGLAPDWAPSIQRASESMATEGFQPFGSSAGLACRFDAIGSTLHLWTIRGEAAASGR